MKKVHYQFLLEAESPISQHSGVRGNHAMLQMSKVRQPSGEFVQVPEVTANSIRHQLREAGAYYCLNAAGMLGPDQKPNLTEGALRLLFNGGMLTGRGDGAVTKLDSWRRLSEALPIIALLGGCADASIIPGKVSCTGARLLCQETLHLMPAWLLAQVQGQIILPWRSQVDVQQRVRFDPTRNPHQRQLMSPEAQAQVEQRLLGKEGRRESGEEEGGSDRGRPMPFTFEAVATGSLWFWDVQATLHTAAEEALLHLICAMWTTDGHVGGKHGNGHGKMRARAAHNVPVPIWNPETRGMDMHALVGPSDEILRGHFERMAAETRKVLGEVDA